jgi:hypothetical protein
MTCAETRLSEVLERDRCGCFHAPTTSDGRPSRVRLSRSGRVCVAGIEVAGSDVGHRLRVRGTAGISPGDTWVSWRTT